MKVLLYSEQLDKIAQSGLGKSIKHQMEALELAGVDYTLDPNDSFDLLHINTYFPQSMLFARKCRDNGIPVVYHAHSTKEDFENSFLFSNQLAPLFKQWLIACYRTGDILITPTPYSKQLLDSYPIDREIVALSNGIQLSKFAPIPNARQLFRQKYNFSNDQFVVIGIGLYLERKGIIEFVELARRMPHIQFIWFGYLDLKFVPNNVRKAVMTELPNLHFAGYVQNDDIILALQGCDVFAFTTFEETEGIPAVEACAARTNFIVRDIPIFESWLKDKETVYKAADIDAYEQLIEQFYQKELPSLTEAAYQIAVERDLSHIGRALKDVYERAIEIAKLRHH
ncbi:MAG: glycosyltransferase [Aerococcaceae bacterium]|nr:glycosyltransferase [Aerococcaceae bacterium]